MKSTWAAVVVTCRDKSTALIYQNELLRRQREGVLDKEIVCLTVDDPASGVGSGGATLNALLLVTEHLSAKAGFTVANPDVLQEKNILVVHAGRSFWLDQCGCAFVAVPCVRKSNCASLVCKLDLLLEAMTKLCEGNPSGIWVCSTDMFLQIKQDIKIPGGDVCCVAVPASLKYAAEHGVYEVDDQNGSLVNVLYQPIESMLKKCVSPGTETVPLVSGIMWLSMQLVEKLLSLIVQSPMDACTYMGLDSGAKPIQISLFFDLLLPMCSGVAAQDFISGRRSGPYGKAQYGDTGTVSMEKKATMFSARRLIWRTLNGSQAKVVVVPGSHCYMDAYAKKHIVNLVSLEVTDNSSMRYNKKIHSFLDDLSTCDDSSLLINTRLAAGAKVQPHCVLSHCNIKQPLTIGFGSILNGIWTIGLDEIAEFQGTLPERLSLQTYHINLHNIVKPNSSCIPVLTVFGICDNLHSNETFCNVPFDKFLERTGIRESDIWSHVSDSEKTLYNARLFPVVQPGEKSVGWKEILWLCAALEPTTDLVDVWCKSWRLSLNELVKLKDLEAEFKWRTTQFFWIAESLVERTLTNSENNNLTGLYKAAVTEGHEQQLLTTLDQVAKTTKDPRVAARTLANIADLLGAMAQGKGGLRSGPASNSEWQPAFEKLESGLLSEAVDLMSELRTNWFDRPDRLVRAARHYEGAAQILIRHAVMTAKQFVATRPRPTKLDMDCWVTVECPARIDIAGGWSDTPPITYEHGGKVLNMAIKIDNVRPIVARVRRIPECKIIIHTGKDAASGVLTIDRLDQLSDYNQPSAPGALLKAALICSNTVQYPSKKSLLAQLADNHEGGFELQTWSNLPQGSGLGTSSILAAALIAALWTCAAHKYDTISIIHAVLHLEQILTTGGGWQDQVGGLVNGIKIGYSPASLPLKVNSEESTYHRKNYYVINQRLVLVYTGKTRLARNLLQVVIRNWYARDEEIVQTVDELVANAEECYQHCNAGNLEGIGACMNKYWLQKKIMAPGCEPESVTKVMEALRPHAHGMCMAGAGGGGFLYLLTKEPKSHDLVRDIIANLPGVKGMTVHEAELDTNGIFISAQNYPHQFHVVHENEFLRK